MERARGHCLIPTFSDSLKPSRQPRPTPSLTGETPELREGALFARGHLAGLAADPTPSLTGLPWEFTAPRQPTSAALVLRS